MKMHCYLRSVPRAAPHNAAHLLASIEGAIGYTVSLIRARARNVTSCVVQGRGTALSRCHIRWLGLTAFRTVLRRKQAVYAELLPLLAAALRAGVFASVPSQMKDVVDPRRSSSFDDILY
mmetsp:Transcript_20917/g.66243  ORF Transcript_20917/g.66243 Transcript_20917/m.66243 type:complete len:120 (-) Transcript_20917:712-1071(-)